MLLMLIAPALQAWLHPIPEKSLHGDFEILEKPVLSKGSWMDASFQNKFDPWMEENIGFHNTLVRTNNQLDYSLFRIPHADGVIRGKNGQLYEYDYIRAWMGYDFVGEKLLDRKLRQFRYLQKHLKDNFNTDLVLVLEPGKASVYPEDIPSKYHKAPAGMSNYDYIARRAEELEINLINFNEYFLEIKDTLDAPVYPIQGTHWSEFAMWYAADSLLNYIEEVREIELRDVIKDDIEYSSELRSTDYDVGITLNLLFELAHPNMPYPVYHFSDDSSHQRPNVLAIADSYYWNIFNTRIPKHVFNNEAFWYFYKKVYPDSYFGEKTVDQLELKAEIEKQDVIFFMTTERFLYMTDRGFVNDAYDIYGMKTGMDATLPYNDEITGLNSWFTSLIAEADNQGITLEEILKKEATFLLWEQEPEKYYSIYGPGTFIKDIEGDSTWYAGVIKRAEESNMSLDDRLWEEADYMLKIKYPEAHKKYHRVLEISANIRADSAWYADVLNKAAANFMTEEEMVMADAEYIYWMENQ